MIVIGSLQRYRFLDIQASKEGLTALRRMRGITQGLDLRLATTGCGTVCRDLQHTVVSHYQKKEREAAGKDRHASDSSAFSAPLREEARDALKPNPSMPKNLHRFCRSKGTARASHTSFAAKRARYRQRTVMARTSGNCVPPERDRSNIGCRGRTRLARGGRKRAGPGRSRAVGCW